MENAWGRRYLMCPPTHFGVLYEINPWMRAEVPVDVDRAHAQWEALVVLLRHAGAEVVVMDAVEGLPDMVFTANGGIVNGSQFVPANFRNPERQGEQAHFVAWCEANGFSVDPLPADLAHEGAGDALPWGGELVSGWRWRTDAGSHEVLADLVGVPVRSIELTDERFYHLDMTFTPLDDRHAIVVPDVWAPADAEGLLALVPEPLVLTYAEAEDLTANSVVVGRNLVMSGCPPRVGRQLEAWGFEVAVADVSEFTKAGGGVRCLTLSLDVVLGSAPPTPPG